LLYLKGGNVVSGNANIEQTNATTLLINQNTDKAIINWNQFNIGVDELTRFIVPSSSSMTLNRVTGGNPSQILGVLQSNGQLWLINPNGVIFGANSQVNAAGIVASTLNIQNEDFLKGNYQLQGNGNLAKIINQGNLIAGDNGIIALIASQVENQGILSANLGTIAIGTGNRASLSLSGNQLLNFSVDQGTVGNFYDNNGQRIASLSNTGKIILSGAGDTLVTGNGQLLAQGLNPGETGGSISVLGNRVGLMDNAQINTSGAAGGGQIYIGGGFHGANPNVQNASQTYIGPNAVISASATQNGNGGGVVQ
jgi:trimeric autotransporter adhesin